MHNTLLSFMCFFFLTACGGGGGESVSAPPPVVSTPTPVETKQFDADAPLTLFDPQSYYVDQCFAPTISSVIPVDINGDAYDDFIVHYWCGQSQFGKPAREPTNNALVAFVSSGDRYEVDNYNVFGDSYPVLTGASRKFVVQDINGDGKDDIAYAMNNEDGRATGPTWEDQLSNGAVPVVLMSNEFGYDIVELGESDWGHAVDIAPNGDVLFAGYNLGTQVYRFTGNDWIDVSDEYPEVSPKSFMVSDNSEFIATEYNEYDRFGVTLLTASTGWKPVDQYAIQEQFSVQFVGWNGNQDQYVDVGVYEFYGKNYLQGNVDRMCMINNTLVAKIQTSELRADAPVTELIPGQQYDEQWTTPVNVLLFLEVNGDTLVEVDSPITDEQIAYNYNDFSCDDISGDGQGDIVASVFSQLWDEDTPERGGVPLVYVDAGNSFELVDTTEWPTFSQELQDSQGYLHDVNNDGLPDLVLFGLTTEYLGDVEIYLSNKEIEL